MESDSLSFINLVNSKQIILFELDNIRTNILDLIFLELDLAMCIGKQIWLHMDLPKFSLRLDEDIDSTKN